MTRVHSGSSAALRAYAQGLLPPPPAAHHRALATASPAHDHVRTRSRLPREPQDFNSDPAETGGVVEEVVSPAISVVVFAVMTFVTAALLRGFFF